MIRWRGDPARPSPPLCQEQQLGSSWVWFQVLHPPRVFPSPHSPHFTDEGRGPVQWLPVPQVTPSTLPANHPLTWAKPPPQHFPNLDSEKG